MEVVVTSQIIIVKYLSRIQYDFLNGDLLRPNAIKLRLFTSPFEKGGLRGILYFNDLNPPCPPFSKGGILNLMALKCRVHKRSVMHRNVEKSKVYDAFAYIPYTK